MARAAQCPLRPATPQASRGPCGTVTIVTAISPTDAYLATTPGGISAVLATAESVKANIALVFGVQTLRLLAMVLLAPAALKWWLRRQDRRIATRASRPAPPRVATAEAD